MKRGQGLPLNVIVLAAIAVIVLVLVVLFATGTITKLFSSTQTISDIATPDEISTFKIACEQYCFQAKQLAGTKREWNSTSYCCKTIITEGDNYTNCFESPIFVSCTTTAFSENDCECTD